MLDITIFSVDTATYQPLSTALNQNQYHQRQLASALDNDFKDVKAEIARNYRNTFIQNGFVIDSFRLNSVKLLNAELVENLNYLLFLQQQLIVAQSYFIARHIKLKFSISSLEYLS